MKEKLVNQVKKVFISMINKIQEMTNYLKNNLSSFRYEHCIIVGNEARKLALHYNLNGDLAYLAGISHDIAKELTFEENAYWIKIGKIPTYYQKEENSALLHGPVGAIILKEKFHLNAEVCNSVYYHTTGSPNMDDFAKIIFIADKIGRKDLDNFGIHLKNTAYQNLDESLLLYITKLEEDLKKEQKEISEPTKQLKARLLTK